MSYYLCYPKYCQDRNNTLDHKQEIISGEVNNNFLSKTKQSPKEKASIQRKVQLEDSMQKAKTANLIQNRSSSCIKDNSLMTKVKSNLIADNDYSQCYQAESHIVKRVNKKDYDNNQVYGKPSNIYSTVMKKQRQSNDETAFNNNSTASSGQGRTFKKLNNSNSALHIQSKDNLALSDCDSCIEMYKSMIIQCKPFQPLQCPQCGNVLTERTYHHYFRIYSTALNNNAKNFDEGRITPQWNNWLKMRSDEKKENLAYDIISGKSQLNQHNQKDAQLNQIISTKKAFLNRLNDRYEKKCE